MHILFLTENFPPEVNASATRVYERACYWIKWGHSVTVVTCTPNFPQGMVYQDYRNVWYQTETMGGIRVVRVKTYVAANRGIVKRTLDFLSFMIMGFLAGIAQPKYDVVAATSPQFFAAVGGFLVGVARRVPFVFELGDLWPATIADVGAIKSSLVLRLMERLELYLYRHSAAVVALTRSFKKDLVRRGISPDKIAVVINGVDLCRYVPRPRAHHLARDWNIDNKFVVGYIGTHGMAHALENVLFAADRLRGEPGICFLFVGDGAKREHLINEARGMGLNNVCFVPPQAKEMMPKVWSICDVALIHLKDAPVFETVIPSKIFEAMGMGLPLIVAAPDGEVSHIVKSQNAGLHVPAEDPDALAKAVRRLYEDVGLRLLLGDNSHRSARLFTRERQARDMLLVMEQIGEGRLSSVPEEVR